MIRFPLRFCQCLLALTLAALSGCGGCRQDEKLTRKELERRAQEQRESLEVLELLSLPTDSESTALTAKAGHWFQTRQDFKSNREDLQVVALGSISRGNVPARVPGTNVVNKYTRRTALPKGQTKTLDLQFYVPLSGEPSAPIDLAAPISNKLDFNIELASWPLMTPILQAPQVTPAIELKENEFQLAVLSPDALSYEFLTVQDAVYWRSDELSFSDRVRSYWVTLVRPKANRYAFPETMLTMTAMAVLVWDDVSPDDLSVDQRNAIVDWVHWGGQLLISGPSSWSRLQNSFLSPYLPANTADAAELKQADFTELSQTWLTEEYPSRKPNDAASQAAEGLQIGEGAMAGLQFNLNEQGRWLPGSGQLVAERAVGRGRVVVTAFSLREPRVHRWKYFSSFLSTGLLRRPPRTFVRNEDRFFSHVWADRLAGRERDPRLHSNVRILSRDLPLGVGESNSAGSATSAAGSSTTDREISRALATPNPTNLASADESATRTIENPQSDSPVLFNTPTSSENSPRYEALRWGDGGSAWNDYSGFSWEASEALKKAAGIELPSRELIIYLLAGYLACLVPLNWVVFRIIGRLELAWLAAPILALVGVAVVTRVAQLDIGFARRTTEISLLELHNDYPRGHLTQYLALYTSLSTNYELEFPETGSVALPMGETTSTGARAVSAVRNLRTNYGRTEGVTLEPLTVYSNSTEIVHAEQIVKLPGGFVLGQSAKGQTAIKNETGLAVQSALVVRKNKDAPVEFAWVGDLAGEESATLEFSQADKQSLWNGWNQSRDTQLDQPKSAANEASDGFWIGGILSKVVSQTPLVDGQIRLIGFTTAQIGDLNVAPKEDQKDGRCIIVCHLASPTLDADVRPDELVLGRSVSGQLDPVP